jgi:hypothetical protein
MALATEPGSGLSATEARSEAQQTMAALRQVSSRGYHQLAMSPTDPDLAPLWARPEFQALMLDLSFPPEPFAN